MSNLIHNFFELVLTSCLNLILGYFHKNAEIYEAMINKSFKLLPYNELNGSALNSMFMLLSMV